MVGSCHVRFRVPAAMAGFGSALSGRLGGKGPNPMVSGAVAYWGARSMADCHQNCFALVSRRWAAAASCSSAGSWAPAAPVISPPVKAGSAGAPCCTSPAANSRPVAMSFGAPSPSCIASSASRNLACRRRSDLPWQSNQRWLSEGRHNVPI